MMYLYFAIYNTHSIQAQTANCFIILSSSQKEHISLEGGVRVYVTPPIIT